MYDSKADVLSKLLTLVQTTWFIIQFLARLASHLPITELEVATVGFATLNVFTYVFWWNKPLNITRKIAFKPNWEEIEAVAENHTSSDDADRATLATNDEDFREMSWGEVREIISECPCIGWSTDDSQLRSAMY